MPAAEPAIPKNPRMPAMTAMTRNTAAQYSMTFLPFWSVRRGSDAWSSATTVPLFPWPRAAYGAAASRRRGTAIAARRRTIGDDEMKHASGSCIALATVALVALGACSKKDRPARSAPSESYGYEETPQPSQQGTQGMEP